MPSRRTHRAEDEDVGGDWCFPRQIRCSSAVFHSWRQNRCNGLIIHSAGQREAQCAASGVRLADKSGTKGSGQMPDHEQAIRELIQSWLTASQKGTSKPYLA